MVTRSRKTMLKNPLDEISTKAKPVAKSPAAKKAARVSKAKSVAAESKNLAKTESLSAPKKTVKTESPSAAKKAVKTEKPSALKKAANTQSPSASKKATQVESSSAPTATAKTKTETRKIKPDVSPSVPPVQDDLTRVSVKDTVLTDAGKTANESVAELTAEQLMANELAQTGAQVINREEELVGHPCTPVKVLDQPGTAQRHSNAGGGAIDSQFLTAEDVFQTELTRARVEIKQEMSRTRVAAVKIVTRWSRWSVAASVIPAPFVDMAAISGVQVKMIFALCKHYEVDFEHKTAIAIASGVTGGAAVQTIASVLAKQILRTMPGVGTFFMFAIEPVISYATTYALGLAFISHFEADGRLHDFNPATINQYLAEQINKRKSMFDTKAKPAPV